MSAEDERRLETEMVAALKAHRWDEARARTLELQRLRGPLPAPEDESRGTYARRWAEARGLEPAPNKVPADSWHPCTRCGSVRVRLFDWSAGTWIGGTIVLCLILGFLSIAFPPLGLFIPLLLLASLFGAVFCRSKYWVCQDCALRWDAR